MRAVATDRRRSVMVMALMLLAALMTVPSALAHGGGAAGQSSRSAPTQRFLAISTDPSDNAKPVVLGFGPIHAKGVDKAVNNHKDIFRFPAGSLVIRHQKVTGLRHHDPVTCLFRFSERGTYRVVRRHRRLAPGRTGTVGTSCTESSSPADKVPPTCSCSRSGRRVRCTSLPSRRPGLSASRAPARRRSAALSSTCAL